jgi:hypothetical protein
VNVADRVALSIVRGHDRTAHQRNRHLTAVCVAGQRQTYARRDQRKDIRVVRDDDDGQIVINRCERARNVMRSFQKVADSSEPEGTIRER